MTVENLLSKFNPIEWATNEPYSYMYSVFEKEPHRWYKIYERREDIPKEFLNKEVLEWGIDVHTIPISIEVTV